MEKRWRLVASAFGGCNALSVPRHSAAVTPMEADDSLALATSALSFDHGSCMTGAT